MNAITNIRRNTVVEMLEAYAKKKDYAFGVFRRDTKGLLDELKFVRFDKVFVFMADWNALVPNAYDNFEYIREQVEKALEPKPEMTIADKAMSDLSDVLWFNYLRINSTSTRNVPPIEKVVHNDPATIVFWADKTKTVVKAGPKDIFDPEKGLAMAIAKKALGNQGNYYNTIKKWLPEEKEPEFMSLPMFMEKFGKISEQLRAFSDSLKSSDEEAEEDEIVVDDDTFENPSIYARGFDESCPTCSKSSEENLFFIKTIWNHHDFVNGYEKVAPLDFNVDGNILEHIDKDEEEPTKPKPEERPYYVWFHGPDTTAWSRYNYAYKYKYSAERYAKKHFPEDWSWIVSRDYIWTKDEAADETPEDYTWDYLRGDEE